ncbi:MAG TPA: hypothetical protein DCX08_09410 [Porticoccaceae bacterium]|nr:hypothetical protein [Porticoccaceae bacterium]
MNIKTEVRLIARRISFIVADALINKYLKSNRKGVIGSILGPKHPVYHSKPKSAAKKIERQNSRGWDLLLQS